MCAVPLPDWIRGSLATATSGGATATAMITGQSLRPPSPVDLRGAVNADGDLVVTWIRRDRRAWSWVDEVDAPLSERLERYTVSVQLGGESVDRECASTALTINQSDLTALGSGTATVAVRQIGDWAASPVATVSVLLP